MIFSYGIGMLAMSLQWVTLLFNYFVSVYLGNEMVLTVLEPYFRRKKKRYFGPETSATFWQLTASR